MKKVKLKYIESLPIEMESNVLYFSKRFLITGHMCPCGCNNKVILPISPTDWQIIITNDEPSLYPSIGNWQLPCKSHYWIENGEITWSYQWSDSQIIAGRKSEFIRSEKYYENLTNNKRSTFWQSILKWIKNRFGEK